MDKPLTTPESCSRCLYNPYGATCEKGPCRKCPMYKKGCCKCLTVPEGAVCPYFEYAKEDICPICGEKYMYSSDPFGARLNGFTVALSIWDNTGDTKKRSVQHCNICPTCGEQLKICMERKPQ